jgi:hypothetical protein
MPPTQIMCTSLGANIHNNLQLALWAMGGAARSSGLGQRLVIASEVNLGVAALRMPCGCT